ncbi:hypothetical protein CYMTET_23661, partial [Cymbomonas tetramitiformis]
DIWGSDVGATSFSSVLPELALDSQGRYGLFASPKSAAPLVQLDAHPCVVNALDGHAGAVTSVDWHPSSNTCLTGSADNSVNVTTLGS